MPHVKLTGRLDIEEVWRNPPAFLLSIPEEDCNFKFTGSFREAEAELCLFRFIVAEGRLTQFVQVVFVVTAEGWILKLDRSTPVLRSPGVKLLLGILASLLEARGLSITKTNIGKERERGAFYAAHLGQVELGEETREEDPLFSPPQDDKAE